MAWDSTLPADTSKIRNLGTEIRPNWDAIALGDDVTATMVPSVGAAFLQQYSAQFIERNGRANTNDPTTDSETLFVYCKQGANGASIAEAHLKDPAGNILQVTQDDHLGSTGTKLYASSVAFDTSVTYDANNMVRAWAIIAAGGASFTTNHGFIGVSNVSTGVFLVDITGMAAGGGNFADGDAYNVIATAVGTDAVRVTVNTKLATSFRISTYTLGGLNTDVVPANIMLLS